MWRNEDSAFMHAVIVLISFVLVVIIISYDTKLINKLKQENTELREQLQQKSNK